MAGGVGLRAFDRAELFLLEDLREHDLRDLFVLATAEGAIELRQSPQGEIVVVAFSGFSLLAASAGTGQPYVRMTVDELERVGEAIRPIVLVGLDVWLPEGHRYPEPDPRDQPPLERLDATPVDEGQVWIPTRPVRRGDRRVTAELHREQPGSPPLLCVYTSLEQLREACGPYQAAAAIEIDRIEQVAQECGAHGVVVNPILAEEARHKDVALDWSRQSHF
ncbi:SAV_915 family protein [Haloechinothrix sp. LS1_15]|uniref:SAV_915 family protein n=1 Tax=Haloechinothrix sp. LS1_15 TaxID=2652248 RepID=UPI002944398A|nr:SAV_915 family protein [Haloechinothrix sp. LS1_15]MDV6011008.1 hypothetical protein [Haloechinothrix sp. LS1_15]